MLPPLLVGMAWVFWQKTSGKGQFIISVRASEFCERRYLGKIFKIPAM